MLAKFSRLEFEAVDGKIRTFYGCSVVGIMEFEERLGELRIALAESVKGVPIEQVYQRDKWVQFLINRLLELNGIKPEWCNWEMISQFLFGRVTEGQVVDGYLIQLNRPDKPKTHAKDGIKIDSKAAAVAAIATHCRSLEEAYRIASDVPANELWQVMDKISEFSKPPEERAKAQKEAGYKSWVERRKAEYAEQRKAG